MLPSQHFVGSPYAGAFNAPKLFHRAPLWCRLAETHVVHLTDNFQASIRIKGELGLKQQAIGPGAARLSSGVKPHTRLADPDEEAANPCCQGNGGVGHPGSGLKH